MAETLAVAPLRFVAALALADDHHGMLAHRWSRFHFIISSQVIGTPAPTSHTTAIKGLGCCFFISLH